MLLAVGVAVLSLVVGIVVVPSLVGDAGDKNASHRVTRAPLTLQQFRRLDTGVLELLVSLPGRQLNTLDVTGGGRLVWLRCFDARGALAIRAPVDWPLLEEPGYRPHIHQAASRAVLDRVRRCRLTGPGILFEGQTTGPAPLAR